MSGTPRALPSRRNCTLATPRSSEAVADTVTLPKMVLPAAGPEMVTDGSVVSAPVSSAMTS